MRVTPSFPPITRRHLFRQTKAFLAVSVIRQELKELGIQTFAVTTPVDPKSPGEYDPNEDDLGTIVETISDMQADLERKQIARRMKNGKLLRAKAGNIPNRVPYGYRVVRTLAGSRVHRTVVLVEEEAARVRFIYDSYANGMGDRKIAIELNRRAWKSPNNTKWTLASVKYVLMNPTYTGKVSWGWRHADYRKTKDWRMRGKVGYIGKGIHEPIIGDELFERVQEIRAGRRRCGNGGAARSLGLLTGIAKCIRCGSGVGYQKRVHNRSKENSRWQDTVTHEYICTGYKYSGICSQRVMSAIKLETAVLDHVRNLYNDPVVQERIVYKGKDPEEIDAEQELARLEREIAMEPVKMQRQHDAYERGIVSMDEYEANLARIREETARNRMEQDRFVALSCQTVQKVGAMAKLVASLKDFDTAWSKMTLDEKKLILRRIIKQIRAGGGRVEIDFIL